mgnify:CR=1 FL=1
MRARLGVRRPGRRADVIGMGVSAMLPAGRGEGSPGGGFGSGSGGGRVSSRLLVIGGDRAGAWWRRCARAWPGGCVASCVGVGVGVVVGGGDGSIGGVVAGAEAALVVVDEGWTAGALLGVIDRLERAGVCGVYVLDGCAGVVRGVLDEERVVLEADSDPGVVVGALVAAVSSGRVSRRLRQELAAAVCVEGGLWARFEAIDDELRLASSVQGELLPREMPRLGRVGTGVFYRPAGHVSGDLYAARELSDGRLLVLVADAMGHGVPAALMTVLLERGASAACAGGGEEITPGLVLGVMNSELVGRCVEQPRFATAVCAVIDPLTGGGLVSFAGHPPALVVGPTGAVRIVEGDGALLGIFEGERYADSALEIGSGETLVLYSDGFECVFAGGERSARGVRSGLVDAFGAAVSGRASGGMEGVVRALTGAVDGGSGSLHSDDDMTALFVGVD